MIGLGKGSFSLNPSGRGTPQSSLLPALYSRAACPAKYPLITISTLKGSQRIPTDTLGSGVAINQLGTISCVFCRNSLAIWFNICPL